MYLYYTVKLDDPYTSNRILVLKTEYLKKKKLKNKKIKKLNSV